jgi:uncharacterized cupin superfamily protein
VPSIPPTRPPFVVATRKVAERRRVYGGSQEVLSFRRPLGRAAGLRRLGLNVERLPPGHRTSWPHAHSDQEEFVFVLEGDVDAWLDGELHRLTTGDLAAFPAGTGIAHTFINNGSKDVYLLVGGERGQTDDRIAYPLHDGRRTDLPWSARWEDPPERARGPHPGRPDALE